MLIEFVDDDLVLEPKPFNPVDDDDDDDDVFFFFFFVFFFAYKEDDDEVVVVDSMEETVDGDMMLFPL